MANQPDAHPDSEPADTGDSPEQVSPDRNERPDGVEDSAGDFAGTAGTGGENKVQDQSFER
jgi:hypothetical protein